MVNEWWSGNSGERYWLEITDRGDLGIDLNAPQTKEGSSKPHWSYELVKHVADGDIVMHFTNGAIVGWSRASGAFWEDHVVWGAHGTSARGVGIEPYLRPGWRIGLEHFTRLPRPVTIEAIRQRRTAVLDLSDELTRAHGAAYFPFTRYGESLRPAQAYLTKFPIALFDVFRELREQLAADATQAAVSAEGAPGLGQGYNRADADVLASARDPFRVDPALVERGLRGHAATQNALADAVTAAGHTPRSPAPSEPDYDLAWEADGVVWVAEVKSVTQSNEEKQLRLGLGQVLRYSHVLRARGQHVRPVLAIERKPTDQAWTDLCREVGVELVWPGEWSPVLPKAAERLGP